MKQKPSLIYPKPRTGKECTKTDCERYESYKAWNCGDSRLKFCMECKHAHVSQFKKRQPEITE